MITFKVSLDIGDLMGIKGAITKEVFPLLNQAVRAIAFQTSAAWKEAVLKQQGLWSGEKDAYAESISWKMTGDFTAVVEATYDQASGIESGRPGHDLKRMLDTSQKVRRTEKTGKRFLVIPMRHNTPGNGAHAKAMPPSVYEMAKVLAPSRIVGQGTRRAGEVTSLNPASGMAPSANQTPFASNIRNQSRSVVNRNTYQWGARLLGKKLKGIEGLTADERRRFSGMYRFDTGTPGAPSSQFLTFRVMMEGSAGWVTKPEPGRNIAKSVEETMRPLAEKAFQEAVKRTLG